MPLPVIPGVKAEGDLLLSFRREVADLLGRNSLGFPGAQPVSFAARHKLELLKQDYYVCEKSDGIRCLMYLTSEGPHELVYLIDRKNDYYHIRDMHFPLSSDVRGHHSGTLVDGELVNEAMPDGSTQLKYLVFDCLVLDGNSLMHRTLDKRLAYFRDNVFEPYQALYKEFPQEKQYCPFDVEFKNQSLSYGVEMVFREILPNLPHGYDGLIFTCRNSAYQFGTDQHILKWKPANENSVDFRLHFEWPLIDPESDDLDENGELTPFPDYSAKPRSNLLVGMGNKTADHYGTMFIEEQEWEDMKGMEEPLDDRIVECYLDDQNRWRFMRFRDDKMEPNHISTVESVMESIQDRVSQEDLIAIAKSIRDEWKKREREAHKAPVVAASPAVNRKVSPHDIRRAALGSNPETLNKTNGAVDRINGTAALNNGAGLLKRKAPTDDDAVGDHSPTRRKVSPKLDS